MNPAWSAPGTPMMVTCGAKEKGVKFDCHRPLCTAHGQALDADWGACAYRYLYGSCCWALPMRCCAWTTKQAAAPTRDFLNRYTVGFDADHKPADLRSDVNFRDYPPASTTAWKRPRVGYKHLRHPGGADHRAGPRDGQGQQRLVHVQLCSPVTTTLITCPRSSWPWALWAAIWASPATAWR